MFSDILILDPHSTPIDILALSLAFTNLTLGKATCILTTSKIFLIPANKPLPFYHPACGRVEHAELFLFYAGSKSYQRAPLPPVRLG